jgi:lipopolysaccharide/colanic/teichoic acid biosynthesis glycosyltransferase
MTATPTQAQASRRLASFYARRKSWNLWVAFVGLILFLPMLWLGQSFEAEGYATRTYSTTLWWCLLPYALAVRWQYKTTHVPTTEQVTLLVLNMLVPFGLLVLAFALLQQPYSRGAVLMVAGVVLFWFGLSERLAQRIFKLELLVLDTSAADELQDQLPKHHAYLGERIALVRWADDQDRPPECDGVMLSAVQALTPKAQTQLAQLKQNHVRLYSAATISELLTGRIASTVLKDPLWQPDGNPAYDIAKRVLDVVVVVATAPAWIPLGALVALAIKWDSPGSAVFSQWRTGQHGRPFRIHKFRTMVVQTQDKAQFAQVNDKRITRLGHFLRKSRLDEIPQLVNVLLGNMSLIGPRPEQHTFVNDFAVTIPSYPYRHLVRPGVTGWAQVMQGYAASAEETSVKLSYDLYYVKHYSLALDLLIVAKTIRTVLTGFGAR